MDEKECALRNANFKCADGESILGNWTLQANGEYTLVSCPRGYEMRTSTETSPDTQECHKCPATLTYILSPDQDECQACPPGLRCFGNDNYEPVVSGSLWQADGAVLSLQSCPFGYSKIAVQGEWADQNCDPCSKVVYKGRQQIAPKWAMTEACFFAVCSADATTRAMC